MKTRKIPLRKSVVSNEVIDKRDLLRIVKNKEGQVFIDPTVALRRSHHLWPGPTTRNHVEYRVVPYQAASASRI